MSLVHDAQTSLVPPAATPSGFSLGKSGKAYSRAVEWCVIVLLVVSTVLPMTAQFGAPALAMDEGSVLVYPELILKGQVPYRDFETFYTPGNLWTLAGAYSVFGVNIAVERSVGFIYRLLLLTGVFLLLRRWGFVAAVGGTIVTALFNVSIGISATAWAGGVVCLVWSILVLAGPPARWRAFTAGLLAGGALLYRIDLGPAMIASALPLLILLHARERWFYFMGGLLALLPLAVLAFVAGLQATWENLFLYPVVLCNPGRRIPISFAPDAGIFLYCLHFGACVCNVGVGLLAVKADRRGLSARLFLSTALLAAGLSHQAMQRADMTHIVLAVFLSMTLLPIALVWLTQRGQAVALRPAWVAGAFTAFLIALAAGSPVLFLAYHYQIRSVVTPASVKADTRTVRMHDRHFPSGAATRQTQPVVDFLEKHSRPGERLFVGGRDLRRTNYNDTCLYHLLPWLTPASYFLEMNPLSANRPNSRLAADIATADWLVLNRVWDVSDELNLSQVRGSDAPNVVVESQFELRGRSGTYEVFRRKAATGVIQPE